MKKTLDQIIQCLKAGGTLDKRSLDRIVRDRNREMHDADRHVAKRRLLSYYLHEKNNGTPIWDEWDIDDELDDAIVSLLRAKPRRTASGVATITVLTPPQPCGSNCIYCPNDIRMPKSYLTDEPACQRAERNFFDPYLQVASRIRVLRDMGHTTDKVELIVLGGTWSDYPDGYRIWFTSELFRALNDSPRTQSEESQRIRSLYEDAGIASDPDEIAELTKGIQAEIDSGKLTYNSAYASIDSIPQLDHMHRFESDIAELRDVGAYGSEESIDSDEVERENERVRYSECGNPEDRVYEYALDRLIRNQKMNESAPNRSVGLVFETRPDMIDDTEAKFMRMLGATKVQMGLQSLDDELLVRNGRHINVDRIANAFKVLRRFGFKIHIHFMLNLIGADPESDEEQYRKLVTDKRFIPDEVKLYPCALVKSSELMEYHERGEWCPYTEEELLDVLINDVAMTPPYTRISRMIRDISAKDIVVGNKKTNLRQMVENRSKLELPKIEEMRMREIATDNVKPSELTLDTIEYETDGSHEYFLQWVTEENRLAAFCRLSLPTKSLEDPERAYENTSTDDRSNAKYNGATAMIREVHVYGKVSRIHESDEGAQHIGLGKKLIETAQMIAREHGYGSVDVISAIGTRDYYRSLGFVDRGLYQNKTLI